MDVRDQDEVYVNERCVYDRLNGIGRWSNAPLLSPKGVTKEGNPRQRVAAGAGLRHQIYERQNFQRETLRKSQMKLQKCDSLTTRTKLFFLQVLGTNENFEIYCIIDTTLNLFEIYCIIDTTLNLFEIYCIIDTTLNPFEIYCIIDTTLNPFEIYCILDTTLNCFGIF